MRRAVAGTPARADLRWVAGGGAASLALGAAVAAGASALAAILAVAAVAGAWAVVRRREETVLIALAATVLMPMPEGLRPALLIGFVALLAVVVLFDDGVPAAALRPIDLWVAGAFAVVVLVSSWGALSDRDAGGLPEYWLALALYLTFFLCVTRRVRALGPVWLAVGIAVAGGLAGLVVLARLGGLPTVGSGSTYESAKDVVTTELGDVNGQALIVMLGLPFLLAFALYARSTALTLASLAGAAVAGLALFVLLSRSSLFGAAIGVAVVMLLLVRLSRWRVLGIAAALTGLLIYSLRDIEVLTADTGNLESRAAIRSTAVDFWRQSPVFGHGPDSWPRLAAEQVRDTPIGGRGGTHNLWLSSLVSAGVVGTLIQVALIGLVLWCAVVGLRRLGRRRATLRYVCLVGATGAFAAQLARGLFEATGWPGFRTNDMRSWHGLLFLAIVAIILSSATEDPGPDDAEAPPPLADAVTPR